MRQAAVGWIKEGPESQGPGRYERVSGRAVAVRCRIRKALVTDRASFQAKKPRPRAGDSDGFPGGWARWLELDGRTGWHHALSLWLTSAWVSVSTAKQVCPAEKLSCGPTSHKCVPASWRCDGEKDCESGVDEAGCVTCESGQAPWSARHGQAASGSSGRCWWRPGLKDLVDGEERVIVRH